MSSNWGNFFLRDFDYSSLFLIQRFKKSLIFKNQFIIYLAGIFLLGCTSKDKVFKRGRVFSNSQVWSQSNSRIVKYIGVYKKNKHVETKPFELSRQRFIQTNVLSSAVRVALELRSLRIHPPHLCRFAVFVIQTNVLSHHHLTV